MRKQLGESYEGECSSYIAMGHSQGLRKLVTYLAILYMC